MSLLGISKNTLMACSNVFSNSDRIRVIDVELLMHRLREIHRLRNTDITDVIVALREDNRVEMIPNGVSLYIAYDRAIRSGAHFICVDILSH